MDLPPCCRAGCGAGYCTTYQQFMPAYLQSICDGSVEHLTAEQCAEYRREWDRLGGPMHLRRSAQPAHTLPSGQTALGMPLPPGAPGGKQPLPLREIPCEDLGQWSGKVCQDCPGKIKLKRFVCHSRERLEKTGKNETDAYECAECSFYRSQSKKDE